MTHFISSFVHPIVEAYKKMHRMMVTSPPAPPYGYSGEEEPVVQRNGDINVAMTNVKKQRSRYMMDLYTTIVDAQWRYTLFIFISGFLFSWLFFGFIWYVIIRVHGDDIPSLDEDHTPCIDNVRTFTAAFLYSLETQHTIGYGGRAITEKCPAAICVLCVQSVTGVMLQAFMAGVVFAKLTRSKARANTLLFSRKAVVCMRGGALVLMFRVADLRKSLIVGANVKAQLIRPITTTEGEHLPYHMTQVKVGSDDYSDDLLFIWPITIVHVIDEQSPFYTMDAAAMLNNRFELIVYLEGTSESTGTTMQARYSYRNCDVLWGNRFERCVQYRHSTMNYTIDFGLFEKTINVATPLVSAKYWKEIVQNEFQPPQPAENLVVFEPSHFNQDWQGEGPQERRESATSAPSEGVARDLRCRDHTAQETSRLMSAGHPTLYQAFRQSRDDVDQNDELPQSYSSIN